ncbi:MAG: type II toxin-antitoxin system RelE/ParE family toxin, partial [Yaniella sp.]|nr:type II toxin-antitoxin system RelE/ParE family toxin [Yaniella sp.]
MTYRIRFTPKANKQVRRLDKPVAHRIREYLEQLDPENPRVAGKPLKGGSGFWRYRVGDYRILVSIQDAELLVLVIDVDHRR